MELIDSDYGNEDDDVAHAETLCGVLTGGDFCSHCSTLVAHWPFGYHGDAVQSPGCRLDLVLAARKPKLRW